MDNNMQPKDYQEMVKQRGPKSSIFKNCLRAFIVGGLICDVGQFFSVMLLNAGLPKEDAGTCVSIIMVFLGAFLTGLGIYDDIGKFGGAGSIVPITGFANSIVSPAMEFKKEGFVLGVGAKMFVIAGPVLVYGITSSVIVGLIYYIIKII
ncbi:MAG TPA: stage V sporulation protein AC [Clostridiaceae bacterium]|nr:stage V sporulation protein AC [Clostridiaceae bacterium]